MQDPFVWHETRYALWPRVTVTDGLAHVAGCGFALMWDWPRTGVLPKRHRTTRRERFVVFGGAVIATTVEADGPRGVCSSAARCGPAPAYTRPRAGSARVPRSPAGAQNSTSGRRGTGGCGRA